MSEIINKVAKMGGVEWRHMEFLQKPDFKRITNESKEKLKQSIINNQVVDLFKVWVNKGKVYCLDGFHRAMVLKELEREGYEIPDILPAQFIDCKDKKEAAKLVLIYSSQYATITGTGLEGFTANFDLNLDDYKFEIEIPKFELPSIMQESEERNSEIINMEPNNECPKCHYKW